MVEIFSSSGRFHFYGHRRWLPARIPAHRTLLIVLWIVGFSLVFIWQRSSIASGDRETRAKEALCTMGASVFRLYTEEYFMKEMSAEAIPKMQRSNLVGFVIQITGETVRQVKAVSSMHQRKAEMTSHSDAVTTLPGGYGTLEELLEVITWA